MNPTIIAIVFGVTFVAELPDKSLFASLVLGTRFRPLPVWLGVAAAFLVHVVIAVTAGGLLTLLPRQIVEGIVAALFLIGAGVLLLGNEDEEEEEGEQAAQRRGPSTLPGIAATSFLVVFAGEWGDITQITTANYAAKYADPFSVAIGALLGLWAVSALAVTAGNKVLDYVPLRLVRRVAGLVLLGFGVVSVIAAIRA